jgi:ubiquinone/menaquinone biosynthesis C-methylase UbiE
MPNDSNLNLFYENIYRSKGRPHEINYKNIINDLYSLKNLNYIQYLTTFIDFNKINKIFDFGSGIGDIGFLLKKKFIHLELFSSENDQHCKEVLKNRGYKNYENLDLIDEKFDLIISTHSLEHMKDFNIINLFKKVSKSNSHLFIEVPNCPTNNFINRPYDSPHLMFFTKKSFFEIQNRFNFDIINLNYSSYSIDKSFEYMKESKNKHENWTFLNKIENTIKNIIRLFLPKIIINLRRYLHEKKMNKLDYFTLNKEDSWCLRCLFKIKDNN